MFNEYTVFQMMKLRQEETERAAKEAWKYFVHPSEKETTLGKKPTVNPCCQCACA
jgi:hypothetical protein